MKNIKKRITLLSTFALNASMIVFPVSCFYVRPIDHYTKVTLNKSSIKATTHKISKIFNSKFAKAIKVAKQDKYGQHYPEEHKKAFAYIKTKVESIISDLAKLILILNKQTKKYWDFLIDKMEYESISLFYSAKTNYKIINDKKYTKKMNEGTNEITNIINKITKINQDFYDKSSLIPLPNPTYPVITASFQNVYDYYLAWGQDEDGFNYIYSNRFEGTWSRNGQLSLFDNLHTIFKSDLAKIYWLKITKILKV